MSFDFNFIFEGLWVGTCPRSRRNLETLVEMGVGTVVNLQSEMDFSNNGIDWELLSRDYDALGIVVLQRPMVDFDEKDIAQHLLQATEMLDVAMKQMVIANKNVYLHCNAGCERSPTVATAWLCWYQGMDLSDAIKVVRNARVCKPYESMLREVSTGRGIE